MADEETPQTEEDLKAIAAERERLQALGRKIFNNQEEANAAAEELAGKAVKIPSTDNGKPRWAIVHDIEDLGAFFQRTNRARGGYISKMENQRMRPQGFRGGGIATRGYGRVRD